MVSDNPSSTVEKELKDVYSPNNYIKLEYDEINVKKTRFINAISDCIYNKMRSDTSVLIMGQDIAEYGGVFKITEGFVDEFGKDRVRNTPIIESGIIGLQWV